MVPPAAVPPDTPNDRFKFFLFLRFFALILKTSFLFVVSFLRLKKSYKKMTPSQKMRAEICYNPVPITPLESIVRPSYGRLKLHLPKLYLQTDFFI